MDWTRLDRTQKDWGRQPGWPKGGKMTTWLHDQRFAAVRAALQAAGAAHVLDLGCGSGDFLVPLAAETWVDRITGIELDRLALTSLRQRLAAEQPENRAKVDLIEGSLLADRPRIGGLDAIVMIEVIEHLDPAQLSVLERVLFVRQAPPTVILTTPNADLNPLLGVPANRMRHPGHRFEWGRARFQDWAGRMAGRCGYRVAFQALGGAHPVLGGASQMAVFVKVP